MYNGFNSSENNKKSVGFFKNAGLILLSLALAVLTVVVINI